MTARKHYLLQGLLFIGVLMGAIDIAVIGPALPSIQAEFDMSSRGLAVLFNTYILFQMIGTQLLAKFADRAGLRTIYVLSISLFALGSLLLVLADSTAMLYTGRAIQGFGAGGIFPVASAVIAARMTIEERGPALGLLGTVWGLAFIIGPVLGGILLRFSWHWLFLVNLPIAAVLVVGALRLLPNDRAAQRRPFDLAGAGVLVVTLIALVFGINALDTADIVGSLVSLPAAPLLASVAVLAPLFWFIEKRAQDPIIRPGMLASRQIATVCVIAAGVGAMQTAGVFYPALAVLALGVSEPNAALLLLPGVLVSTVCAPIVGRLINVVGTRLIVLVALIMMTVSFLMYGHHELTLQTFVLANLVGGLGVAGLVGAPLRWTMLNETGPRERAAAQGLLSNVTSVGRLVGAATVGAVAAAKGSGAVGYQSAFVGMAILAVSLFAIALTLKSKTQEMGEGTTAEAAV